MILHRRLDLRRLLSIGLTGALLVVSQMVASFPRVQASTLSVTVSGNRLLDGSGRTLQLHGVNGFDAVSPCVYNNGTGYVGYGPINGPTDAASIRALLSWNINSVRLQLNEDCWLSINGVPAAYSGANYQSVISSYVASLTAAGIYVILDLHWTAPGTIVSTDQDQMPDRDHAGTFWTSVASAFKSNSAVIFDLFNESKLWSTAANWACWRDGCNLSSDYPGNPTFTSIGIQALLSAVRATGATNVVLVGGPEYSGTFIDHSSPPVNEWNIYRPVDPLNQMAASAHVYPFTTCHDLACWRINYEPVARSFPVITGELGDGDGSPAMPCDGSFIGPFMSWADPLGISYMAFTWNLWGICASLIADAGGTAVNHGIVFKQHLLSLPVNPPPPAPTVSAVAPTSGPAAGGTSVTITGTNLTGASAVKFGTVAATTYAVNSATQITATSPAGSGTVDVTVTTAGGTSATSAVDKFTYTLAPTVVSVAPNTGLTTGGTTVTIAGTNFTGATAVKFGTATATFTVTSATQIMAASPPGSGTVDVTVTGPSGSSATSAADKFAYTSPRAAYTAQSPNRILDTRASGQTLSGGGSLNLTVAGGTTAVPATATGVILNITVTNTTAPSFLTVWPAGSPRATVSNLNWVAGETRANLVNVSVGAGGQVSMYNGVGSADVVVDEEGYFAAPVGMAGGYNSLTPARLLDTRSSAQTMSTGSTIDLQVLGAGGVPATGVSAVVLNVTATNTATQGYFTVFPSGTSRPTASNVNWAARWTLPNRVIVKVGTNGKVSIYNGQGAADAVVDVSGYFSDATASGKFFTQVSPVRVLDTRISGGTLGPSGTYPNLQLIGNDGVPTGATAVFLNATVTNTTASSFLTAFPNARPTASDLNWVAGQTIPNSTLATLSSTGTSSFYNGVGWADLVLDLSGWFS